MWFATAVCVFSCKFFFPGEKVPLYIFATKIDIFLLKTKNVVTRLNRLIERF